MKGSLLCGLVLLLTACAITSDRYPSSGSEQAWLARTQTLSALDSWSLTGRIAIQAEREAWNAAVRWSQQGNQYTINLSAPLGQGVVQVEGDDKLATLRTADKQYFAEDGESLLRQRLGWSLPVDGLRYWAVGLPIPLIAAQERQLDELGRLQSLRQSGWNIEFKRYTQVGNVELPDKIFLVKQDANPALDVRLVVQRWEVK